MVSCLALSTACAPGVRRSGVESMPSATRSMSEVQDESPPNDVILWMAVITLIFGSIYLAKF
jgi:hypothetical protein